MKASLSTRAVKAGFTRTSGRTKHAKLMRKRRRNTSNPDGKIRAGRPQRWHRERTFKYLCERVSRGDLVTYTLRKIGLDPSTLSEWIRLDATGRLAKVWEQAKRNQARAIADRAMRVASGKDGRGKAIKRHKQKLAQTRDPRLAEKIRQLEFARVARNKLEVSTAQWFVKHASPSEFGDKTDITSGGKPLESPPQHLRVSFVTPEPSK